MQAVPLAHACSLLEMTLQSGKGSREPKEMKTGKETIKKEDVLGDGMRSIPKGS